MGVGLALRGVQGESVVIPFLEELARTPIKSSFGCAVATLPELSVVLLPVAALR